MRCQGFTAGMRWQYSLLLICVDRHLFYSLVYWLKVDLLWCCAFNNVQLSFFIKLGFCLRTWWTSVKQVIIAYHQAMEHVSTAYGSANIILCNKLLKY